MSGADLLPPRLWMIREVAALSVAVVLTGCELPRDPERTLETVRGGRIRVGVILNPPWVAMAPDGSPDGIEVEIVERIAESLQSEVTYVWGTTSGLFRSLEEFELDLVVGGFHADTPGAERIGLTRGWLTIPSVIASRGSDPPAEWGGVSVAVRTGCTCIGKLEQTGARPVRVTRLSASPYEFVAGAAPDVLHAGFTRPVAVLEEYNLVAAVPPGENRWLMEVERFYANAAPAIAPTVGGRIP